MISRPSAQGRAGQGRRRRCVGAVELHGCVGRDVPHHHVGGLAARRHDGHACAAIIPTSRTSSRPSATRRACAMFNLSVLVTRCLHGARSRRMRTGRSSSSGNDLQDAAAPAPCGTRSCARPMTMPSPASSSSTASMPRTISPIARRSTRPIPAANSPCRPMALASWARSIWRASSSIRSRMKPGSTRPRCAMVRQWPCASWTMSSTFPIIRSPRSARRPRPSGGSGSASPALPMRWPCAGIVYGSEAAARWPPNGWPLIEHAAYRASIELAREKGAFPLFDRERYLDGGHAARLARGDPRRASPRMASATRFSPRSRRPARSRSLPAMCRAASSRSSRSATSARSCMPDGTRRSERVEDYAAELCGRSGAAMRRCPPAS